MDVIHGEAWYEAPNWTMHPIRELKDRDYRDRHRAESPLQPAPDAVILDSTAMTLDQVLARAEEIVRSHLPREAS